MFLNIPNTLQKINFETKEIISNNFIYNINGNTLKLKLINGEEIAKSIDWIRHIINLNYIVNEKFMYILKYLDFKKIKPHGVSTEYHYLPVFTEPQTIKINKIIFRILGRFPKYCINQYGEIYNFSDFDIPLEIKPLTLVHEYIRVNIFDTLGFLKFIGVHRLVAMAWVPNDDYVNKNIVDHDDRNKKNNYYKNLSWTNNSGNVSRERINYGIDRYAVKQINSDQINYCNSLREISNVIGYKKIDLSGSKIKIGKIWKGANGKFEIAINDKNLIWFYNSPNNLDKKYLVIKNSLRYYFKELDGVYSFLNIDKSKYDFYAMIDYVNNKIKNTNIYYSLPPRNLVLREMKNIKTKEIFYADKWRDVQKIIKASKGIIIKFLHTKIEDRLINDTWLLRYKSDKPWADETGDIKSSKNKKLKVLLIDESGNTKYEFPSIINAAAEIKTSGRTIVKKIMLNKKVLKDNVLYNIVYSPSR